MSKKIVVVLGMHRSGTSAITRGLTALDIPIGDSFHPGAHDNPKGFWEDKDILEINEELLAVLDSAYDRPGLLGWHDTGGPEVKALIGKASDLLRTKLEESDIWAFKDPRTPRLLAFWQDVFSNLDVEEHYIIAVRNPVSIARSLEVRNQIRHEKSDLLWLEHMLPAVLLTNGKSRVFVDYDRLLDEPERELARIAESFGFELIEDEVRKFSQEFLEEGLRHSCLRVEDLQHDDAVSKLTCEAYALLDQVSSDEVAADAQSFVGAWLQLQERLEDVAPIIREFGRVDADVHHLRTVATEKDAKISMFTHALAERESQVSNQSLEINRLKKVEKQNIELNQSLAERNTYAVERNTYAMHLERELQTLMSSRSWRVTQPMRSLGELLRNRSLTTSDRQLLVDKLRNKCRRMPLPEGIKRPLRVVAHKLFGPPKPMYMGGFVADGTQSRSIDPGLGTSYRILCLPVIEWDFRFQRPQQLMTQFAQAGHRIDYVSLIFDQKFSVKPLADNINGVTLPGPVGINPYREKLDKTAAEKAADEMVRQLDLDATCPISCVVQLPFWLPLVEALAERVPCKIIYDCMDDHSGFTSNSPEMTAAEQCLVRSSDMVIASSQLLFDQLVDTAKSTILVRNAADFEHFDKTESSSQHSTDRPIIGYFGAISDWFDIELMVKIARLKPDWRFQLVGSSWGADVSPLKALNNLELLGEKPYADLPELVGGWDCCIIPFQRCPLTDATNPVKVYEMLAAGKPVVAIPLPELLPIAEQDLIRLAEGADDFIEAIEAALRTDSEQRIAQRKEFAAQNTWNCRMSTIDQAVRQLWPLASVVVVTYNNLDLNRLCMASLLHTTNYPNLEVLVVDNASSDGTPEYLRSLEEKEAMVQVVLNEDNLGFAKANNQGLELARGDFFCLLNNDTVVTPGCLLTLINHLQKNPELGLVGPVTNAISNEACIDVGYEKLEDMPSWSARYCRDHRQELIEIPMLAFFCVAIRRAVFVEIGKLDESFGLGMFEDDDYCRRIQDAGYQLRCAHDAFVHHWQKASFNLIGEKKYLEIYHENKDIYQSKWKARPASAGPDKAELRKRIESASGVIVFAPSVGWNIHLFQRPHHLALVLARMGYVVIFDVSNAVDQVAGFKEVEENLFLFRGDAGELADLPGLTIWTFTYNYGYRDFFPQATRVIYDWIDDLEVFPYDQKLLAQLHSRAMKESDIVACVAKALLDDAVKSRPDTLYLPNGVEYERFATIDSDVDIDEEQQHQAFMAQTGPLCGYYGALASWFNYSLLEQVARKKPDWRFLLIGPDYDGSIHRSRIAKLKNVRWVGPRDYATLPRYLARFDVAMIPFAINDITRATSPLKLYEYFAGGKPVVTTPMPECMQYPEVFIANDSFEFERCLDQAHVAGKDEAFIERARELGFENSWETRVKTVLDSIVSS